MSRPPILCPLVLTCIGLFTGCEGNNGSSPSLHPATVVVTCERSQAMAGETIPCTASSLDQYGEPFPVESYLWTTGNSDVATVDETGKVLTKARGSTSVSAKALWEGRDLTGRVSLLVLQKPYASKVTVTCEPTSVVAGATAQCTASTVDSEGKLLPVEKYLWESSNSDIATVDEAGKVLTRLSGYASVSARATWEERTVTGQTTMMVLAPPYASRVTVTCEPTSLVAGGTSQCTASTVDSAGNLLPIETYLWESSNSDVATVDETGKVLTRLRGYAYVSARATWKERTVSGRSQLTVLEDTSPRLTTVTATCESTPRWVGRTVQCAARARDQRGDDYPVTRYVWTSSEEKVAKVDPDGKVSLVGLGTAVVSAAATEKGITKEGRVTLAVKGPIEHRDPITASETWLRENNPHVVTTTLVVGGPQDPILTLESGVEVLFESGAALVIGSDEQNPGTLLSVGSSSRPIRFSARSDTPQPGHWAGVYFFQTSTVQSSRLAYTTVEYAGAPLAGTTPPPAGVQRLNGAVNLLTHPDATVVGPSLSVSNLEVRNNKEYGVVLGARLSSSSTQLRVYDNGKAGLAAAPSAVGSISADSQFRGNAINEVMVWGGEVKTTQTWRRLEVPYRLFSLVGSQPAYVSVGSPSAPTLILAAGTTFLMPAGSAFLFGLSDPGRIFAEGNTNEPIQFVADTPSPTPGFWSGLHLMNASRSTLSYVQISHAGARLNGTLGGGAVNVYKEQGAFLTQSTLSDSSSCGVSVAASVTTDFTRPEHGNVFTRLAGAPQCRQ